MAPPIIELEGITKHFVMDEVVVRALNGVDLAVEEGELLAISGPSGSGKTTLLHIIGCLLRPTAGAYRLRHRSVERFGEFQLALIRNGNVGFVFQAFNLLPRLTALQNVEIPLVYGRVPRRERRRRATALLSEIGLGHRLHHLPSQLSGGEQQRVAIARALVNDPSLILADEPTGNLDTESGAAVMDLLVSLNARGKTVIIVTHEQSIASRTRRQVALLDGKCV